MLIKRPISRRTVLRGVVGGIAVNVGLPLLDCFLNENGTAMAGEAPMPVRFGTWFWGLGMDKGAFIPKKVGADYDLPPQIASWKDVKQHVNLFTNFNVLADGKPAGAHFAGWVACLTGSVPTGGVTEPTIDVMVADTISGASRFRSIGCAATGSVSDSYSMRSSDSINPPETSAIDLYQKLYGAEFQDPNSPEFTPRPSIMLKKSVLAGVREDSSRLLKRIGAADRVRMDQYFTSLREAEQRLEQQLQKPPAAPSCRKPEMPADTIDPGTEVELVRQRHKEMAQLLAMALACNQTRVFHMAYSNSLTGLSKQGLDKIHHAVTHEESVDDHLGYQPTSFWFLTRAFESYAYFIQTLASIPEGSGTLLDNCAVFSCSDSEFAKNHSIDGIPMMLAGKGGGRLRTGYHIDGKGAPVTHVGYTAMKAMNVPITEWGTGSMRTTHEISEILV